MKISSYSDRPEFSVLAGIAVQEEQMEGWKSVLKEDAFERLQALVTAENSAALSGYDICRGNDIDMIVHNVLMAK